MTYIMLFGANDVVRTHPFFRLTGPEPDRYRGRCRISYAGSTSSAGTDRSVACVWGEDWRVLIARTRDRISAGPVVNHGNRGAPDIGSETCEQDRILVTARTKVGMITG